MSRCAPEAWARPPADTGDLISDRCWPGESKQEEAAEAGDWVLLESPEGRERAQELNFAREEILSFASAEEPVDANGLRTAAALLNRLDDRGLPIPEVKPDPPDGVLFLWSSGTSHRGRFLDVQVRADSSTISKVRTRDGRIVYSDRREIARRDRADSEIVDAYVWVVDTDYESP